MARTTVADVLADGLARAGAGRIFVAPAGGAGASDGAITALRQAAARRGLPALDAPDAAVAARLAAVSGEVGRRARSAARRPGRRAWASCAVSPTRSAIARR